MLPVPICPDSSALVPKCLTEASAPVTKCLGSEVSWVQSVLTPPICLVSSALVPKCLGSKLSGPKCLYESASADAKQRQKLGKPCIPYCLNVTNTIPQKYTSVMLYFYYDRALKIQNLLISSNDTDE